MAAVKSFWAALRRVISGPRIIIIFLLVYIAATGLLAIVSSVWAWRVAERASVKGITTVPTSFLWWDFRVSRETSIFLIVVSFGVVGSTIHSVTSLTSFVGNRRFKVSWLPWYLLRPLIAASLALLAYVVFRGGFLATTASTNDLNLFGVAAIAGFAGLFSKQVTDKLEQVMNTVFANNADEKRTDSLESIAIAAIDPKSTPAATPVSVVITGTGFGDSPKVLVNGDEREPKATAAGSVTVDLTAVDVAAPADLEIRVKSSSGETSDAQIFKVV